MSELGQALKEAREDRGMTLDDIQDLTKIQKRYLIAIEAGDFSKLPGNFYTRAFMKSYAEAVGLDPKEIFEQYSRDLPRLEIETEATPSRSRTHKVKTNDSKVVNALPKVAIVVVLLIVLIGIWVVMQKMTSGEGGQADNPDQGVVIKNGNNLGNGKSHKKTKATTETNDTSTGDKASKDDQKSIDNSGTSSQQLKLENSEGQISHFTLSGTDQFVVEIDAKDGASSWITAAKDKSTGERYYFDFVSKGAKGKTDASFQKDLSDLDTLYIKVGSAPNTLIKINGQPFSFPDNGTVQQIYITHKKSQT